MRDNVHARDGGRAHDDRDFDAHVRRGSDAREGGGCDHDEK